VFEAGDFFVFYHGFFLLFLVYGRFRQENLAFAGGSRTNQKKKAT
jgi:hypothetical protein